MKTWMAKEILTIRNSCRFWTHWDHISVCTQTHIGNVNLFCQPDYPRFMPCCYTTFCMTLHCKYYESSSMNHFWIFNTHHQATVPPTTIIPFLILEEIYFFYNFKTKLANCNTCAVISSVVTNIFKPKHCTM